MLQKEICQFYHRWHSHEQNLKEGVEILDFDLCPRDYIIDIKKPFTTRGEALTELERLIELVTAAPSTLFANQSFIIGKLKGSHSYLKSLLGESISFKDYLFSTIGIHPERLKEDEIQELQNDLETSLASIGLKLEPGNHKEIQEKIFTPDKFAIASLLPKAAEKWASLACSKLGISVNPSFTIEVVEADSYWLNWITGKAEQPFHLKVNTHPRNSHWHHAEDFFAAHEIAGHALHGTCLQEGVKTGLVDPAALNITIHSFETFHLEGIAQTVALLFQDNLALSHPWVYVRNASLILLMALLNDAQIRLEQGEDFEAMVQYILKNHLLVKEETVRSDLNERMNGRFMGAYQHVYYPAYKQFIKLRTISGEARFKILKKLYSEFYTPAQLKEIIDHAVNESLT